LQAVCLTVYQSLIWKRFASLREINLQVVCFIDKSLICKRYASVSKILFASGLPLILQNYFNISTSGIGRAFLKFFVYSLQSLAWTSNFSSHFWRSESWCVRVRTNMITEGDFGAVDNSVISMCFF
jgi:hypothetical protein